MNPGLWLFALTVLDRARLANSELDKCRNYPLMADMLRLVAAKLTAETPTLMPATEKAVVVGGFDSMADLFLAANHAHRACAGQATFAAIKGEIRKLGHEVNVLLRSAVSRWLPELWVENGGEFAVLKGVFDEVGRDLPSDRSLGAFFWENGGSVPVPPVTVRRVGDTVEANCTLCAGRGSIYMGQGSSTKCGLCKGTGKLTYASAGPPSRCPVCGGRGKGVEEGEPWVCVTCNGSGVRAEMPDKGHRMLCPVCRGVEPEGTVCSTCGGLGIVDDRKVKVNYGSNEGGEGGPQTGGRCCP